MELYKAKDENKSKPISKFPRGSWFRYGYVFVALTQLTKHRLLNQLLL